MSDQKDKAKRKRPEGREKSTRHGDDEDTDEVPSSSANKPRKPKKPRKPEKPAPLEVGESDEKFLTPRSTTEDEFFSVQSSTDSGRISDAARPRRLESIPEATKVDFNKETTLYPLEADDEKSKETLPVATYSDSDAEARKSWGEVSRGGSRRSRLKSLLPSTSSTFITNLLRGGVFIYMIIPPDGGYAWVVLVMSFLCQMIVDGIIFSLGIVLPFMAEDFGSTPGTIALVASTQIGPISTAFINKYGFRPVAFMGASLSICNIIIASFSPNIAMLITFYSILGGISLSMIWIPSQLIIGYYFEKYRPIAAGVSCSGAGIGVVLFSYMNGILVTSLGWRNTSRIHACFLVIVLFITLSYIEVKPTRIGRMLELNPLDTDTDSSSDYMHSVHYSRLNLHQNEDRKEADKSTTIMASRFVEYEGTHHKEVSKMNACCQRCCPAFKRFVEQRHATAATSHETHLVIQHDPMERQDLYYTGPARYSDEPEEGEKKVPNTDVEVLMFPQKRQTMRSINYKLSMMHSPPKEDRRRSTKMSRKSTNTLYLFFAPSNWVHPKIKRAFKLLFDFSLLSTMEFQVLVASAFFFTLGFNIPFMYSKVRAEIEQAQFISPIIGLSNFTFRIIAGFIAFQYREYTTYICAIGITFGGVATLVSAFYGIDMTWFQFLYAVCFGLAPAFYSTLRAIIYVRMLGLSKLTNAFGLAAMAMGLGVFIGTYTGGALIEYTESYMATYIFSGLCITIAGVLKMILPTLVKWKAHKEAAKHKITFTI